MLQRIGNNQPPAFHPIEKRAHVAQQVVDRFRTESALLAPRGERVLGNVTQRDPAITPKQFWKTMGVFAERVARPSRSLTLGEKGAEVGTRWCLPALRLTRGSPVPRRFALQLLD